MSGDPAGKNTTTILATVGILLLPVLCCGLPLLIAAGAFGALGAVLGSPWVIAVAVVLVAGLVGCEYHAPSAGQAGDGCMMHGCQR
ncbi:MAG: hypothetical protein ACYCZY_10165 [Lacisediminihabitans sp.]